MLEETFRRGTSVQLFVPPSLFLVPPSLIMSITITVKLFAAYQEAYGKPELKLDFAHPITANEALDKILEEKPELEKWREVTRFGVNLQFVTANTILNDGDEVVFIPPVSGG